MESNAPLGDWGLASQAHELELGYLGNRRGFSDEGPAKKPPLPKRTPARQIEAPIVA